MINPFDTTEEDEFINQNQYSGNTAPTSQDIGRLRDLFSRADEAGIPFLSEYTQDLPEDIAETKYNTFEDRPETELEKQQRILEETELVSKQQDRETLEMREQELLGAKYQEEEFAKAREQRAMEIAQEESSYEQRMAEKNQPVKEFIDIGRYAEKVYTDKMSVLNQNLIDLVSDGEFLTSDAGKIRKTQIELQMANLESSHKLFVNNVIGKGFSEAPMQVREVYQNRFLGAVQEGALSPTDGLAYAYDHYNIIGKVNVLADKLKTEKRTEEWNMLEKTVLGDVRKDRMGNPILGPDGEPLRQGGLVRTTPYGTYEYNTDEENFNKNFENILIGLGEKKVEKPSQLFKEEEDILKPSIKFLEDENKQILKEADATTVDDLEPQTKEQFLQNKILADSQKNELNRIYATRLEAAGLDSTQTPVGQNQAVGDQIANIELALANETDKTKKEELQKELDTLKASEAELEQTMPIETRLEGISNFEKKWIGNNFAVMGEDGFLEPKDNATEEQIKQIRTLNEEKRNVLIAKQESDRNALRNARKEVKRPRTW
jgi:hypothetical protein